MAVDSQSNMMKTTQSGRPFVKDIHDLFSTLIVILPFDTHRFLFKAYPNTFAGENAILSLGELRFSQTNKSIDPKDPTKVLSTTIITTFSMARDIARNLCQLCINAHLFENSQDTSNRTFKEKHFYSLTPKGAYIIDLFLKRSNMVVSGNLESAILTLPTANVLFLQRTTHDDNLILTPRAVITIFKRFAGPAPNDVTKERTSNSSGGMGSLNIPFRDLNIGSGSSAPPTPTTSKPKLSSDASSNTSSDSKSDNRNQGIEVKDRMVNAQVYKHSFTGLATVEWLLDLTTAINQEEAQAIGSEFLRMGLIEYVRDAEKAPTDKENDNDFFFSPIKASVYILTAEGRRAAGWEQSWDDVLIDGNGAANGAANGAVNGSSKHSSALAQYQASVAKGINGGSAINIALGADRARERALTILGKELDTEDEAELTNARKLQQQQQHQQQQQQQQNQRGASLDRSKSLAQRERQEKEFISPPASPNPGAVVTNEGKETNATKLHQILNDPTLLILFREHLRQQFCEENIAFWLAHQDLSRKYQAVFTAQQLGRPHTGQKDLLTHAFDIYDTFLAPAAPNELNIDHIMHQEIIQYMDALVNTTYDRSLRNNTERTFNARASLLHIVKLFEKVDEHVYRLMATDSVPKFVRTEKYREVLTILHGKRDSGNA